jgi:hypothetical protein
MEEVIKNTTAYRIMKKQLGDQFEFLTSRNYYRCNCWRKAAGLIPYEDMYNP